MNQQPRIEALVFRSMNSRLIRYVSKYPIALGQLLNNQKQRWYDKESDKLRRSVFETALGGRLVVHDGPFKGLRYPKYAAKGSELLPKLIGSYEEELHPIFETIKERKYPVILDIGCAEGYYAVGLALVHPEARVFAYDIDKDSIHACKEMATLNAVDNRMEFGRFCDDDLLSCFNFGERGLIVCDVEGYERDLFTLAAKKNLGRCDILIEFHDFIGRSITDGIMQVLDESHTCQLIDMKPRTPGNMQC